MYLKKILKLFLIKKLKIVKKNDWHKIKLSIDLNNYTPKDDELMFCYGDLWKTVIKK